MKEIYLPIAVVDGHATGRHVRHDPLSRNFPARAEVAEIKDKVHRNYGYYLDQLNVGACTGFTAAHHLNGEPLWPLYRSIRNGTFRFEDAMDFYGGATRNDPWPGSYPPEDTGSSALGIAKYLMSIGLISRYEWFFGLEHGVRGIMQSSIMQGTWWTYDMFYPDRTGRVRPTGGNAGGHEYLWLGIDVRSKLSPSQNRSIFMNSWSRAWGAGGRFWMTWEDQSNLLEQDGDLMRLIK